MDYCRESSLLHLLPPLCCGYLLESPRRGDSNKYSHSLNVCFLDYLRKTRGPWPYIVHLSDMAARASIVFFFFLKFMHYYKKKQPLPHGASFINQTSLFLEL